jgi:hypothetical protein
MSPRSPRIGAILQIRYVMTSHYRRVGQHLVSAYWYMVTSQTQNSVGRWEME